MRVLVVGGHGKVARLLLPLLDEATAVFRNADHTAEVAATGAEPVVFDVEQASVGEMAALFAGHDAVVWSAGAGGGNPERTYAVDRDAAIRSMDAAQQAGVGRYVMVSYFGAGLDHGVSPENGFYAYAQAKAEADAHLRASSLSWTILGPSALTDEAGTGRIETAEQGSTSGSVSRADVAAVVAEVLGEPSTVGRTINFNNGATPIAEAVRLL
ncbi:SDR family oxidoreductase [Actinoplanes sp. NPDC049596]|uniref:SDR family oxidoreductase n=1 Tax=unclassified Actinoplanes TaxID=2626549 RepID=UPI00342A15C1